MEKATMDLAAVKAIPSLQMAACVNRIPTFDGNGGRIILTLANQSAGKDNSIYRGSALTAFEILKEELNKRISDHRIRNCTPNC